MKTLPSAYDDTKSAQTLVLNLEDKSNGVITSLYYTVFENTDVITRHAVLLNNSQKTCEIRKLMSANLDMMNRDFSLITFDGGWIKRRIIMLVPCSMVSLSMAQQPEHQETGIIQVSFWLKKKPPKITGMCMDSILFIVAIISEQWNWLSMILFGYRSVSIRRVFPGHSSQANRLKAPRH